jgi:carboxymethylenebutenolidase
MCNEISCYQTDHAQLTVDPESRRLFLKGVASLPLAYVLADVELARAAAHGGETISLDVANVGSVNGFYVKAENANAPTVLLIHEWWGLNDHIKAMAAEFAAQGFHALAVDLFKGSVATDRDGAMAQIKALNPSDARLTMNAWVDWARDQGNGRVGTCGWCFGGGWSLQTALSAQPDASVIYYGRVGGEVAQLRELGTPLLGHFGTLDQNINPQMVGAFKHALRDAGKADHLTTYWYTADHAFANPTGGRYDEDDAALAFARTLTFLESHLRG